MHLQMLSCVAYDTSTPCTYVYKPDPREDPKSKTPNYGLECCYWYGVDDGAPSGCNLWIRP